MPSTPSRMVELSTTISENTAILDQYLKDSDLPQPSFDDYEPIWDKDFPAEIQAARLAIQNATTELCELTMGSNKILIKALQQGLTSMDTFYRLDIPHKVPLDDPEGITYLELCSKIDKPVNEYALTRILRSAIVNHIFKEPSPGRIAHSAASRLLATNDILFDFVGSSSDVLIPRQYLGQAIERFPEMDESNRTAASIAHSKPGEDLISFYEYIAKEPWRAKRFGRAMTNFQSGPEYSANHVVEGFDWGGLPAGSVVVDVGGSHGDIDIAVARKFKHLKFIVQDLPDTVSTASDAKKLIENEGLSIEFIPHDFLTPQPILSARVYILRWILHNWPDKYCIQILRNIVSAMEPGSKVLVVDAVMPELGSLSLVEERQLRFSDVTMLSCFNAGDREVGWYERISGEAGLRFEGARRGEGSRLWFLVGGLMEKK